MRGIFMSSLEKKSNMEDCNSSKEMIDVIYKIPKEKVGIVPIYFHDIKREIEHLRSLYVEPTQAPALVQAPTQAPTQALMQTNVLTPEIAKPVVAHTKFNVINTPNVIPAFFNKCNFTYPYVKSLTFYVEDDMLCSYDDETQKKITLGNFNLKTIRRIEFLDYTGKVISRLYDFLIAVNGIYYPAEGISASELFSFKWLKHHTKDTAYFNNTPSALRSLEILITEMFKTIPEVKRFNSNGWVNIDGRNSYAHGGGLIGHPESSIIGLSDRTLLSCPLIPCGC